MAASEAGNQSVSDLLLADARWLLGDSAARTIFAMQVSGEVPLPGTPGWDFLVAEAAAGNVEIVTRVMVRAPDPVPVPPPPAPPVPPPPAPRASAVVREPTSLADEMRAMGLM